MEANSKTVSNPKIEEVFTTATRMAVKYAPKDRLGGGKGGERGRRGENFGFYNTT